MALSESREDHRQTAFVAATRNRISAVPRFSARWGPGDSLLPAVLESLRSMGTIEIGLQNAPFASCLRAGGGAESACESARLDTTGTDRPGCSSTARRGSRFGRGGGGVCDRLGGLSAPWRRGTQVGRWADCVGGTGGSRRSVSIAARLWLGGMRAKARGSRTVRRTCDAAMSDSERDDPPDSRDASAGLRGLLGRFEALPYHPSERL